MTIVLEQFLTTETLRTLRDQAGHEGRHVQEVIAEAIAQRLQWKEVRKEWEMKVQKDLNDLPGSWADDPDFANTVMDFLYV